MVLGEEGRKYSAHKKLLFGPIKLTFFVLFSLIIGLRTSCCGNTSSSIVSG